MRTREAVFWEGTVVFCGTYVPVKMMHKKLSKEKKQKTNNNIWTQTHQCPINKQEAKTVYKPASNFEKSNGNEFKDSDKNKNNNKRPC